MTLEPRVALISGAAGSIGGAVAAAFANHGFLLGLTDKSADALGSLTERLQLPPSGYVSAAFDAADPSAMTTLVQQCEGDLGPITALVNCVGFFQITPFDAITDEDWDATLRSNLTSVFVACRAVVPVMMSRRAGTVINFSSTAGETGSVRPAAHYAAAKGAVIAFSKSLAREVSPFGVRVNVVSPGPVDTPMLQADSPEARERVSARTLLGRIGTPEEVAAAVIYLAEEASYTTGHVLRVNGGALL
ncbi:MAG TPA: SDR family oxidoreductase [Acidimicrobiales bacterium]|nr:SDR family oxidoreductase [Acidimicrobiales bacterium]